MLDNQESKKLLTDMRMQVSYSDVATMPIPLYERIKAALGVQESPSKELEQKGGDLSDNTERVLKFRLKPEYYPCRCTHCGLLASSEHFAYISHGDDGEVSCPNCYNGEKHLEMDDESVWRRMLAQSLDIVEAQTKQLTATQQALDSAVEALHKWQSINIENGGHSCQSLFVAVKEMQKQTKAALGNISKQQL